MLNKHWQTNDRLLRSEASILVRCDSRYDCTTHHHVLSPPVIYLSLYPKLEASV